MIKNFFKRLWSHFGWGWHGHSVDKLFHRRINPERQALKAYCAEYGLTRKAAKKGFRQAKMWRKNWAAMKKAERDALREGRKPVFRTVDKQNY